MDNRRYSPSASRNRDPIAKILQSLLPERGLLLEVASGSGEHAAHIAPRLPGWTWQPSERDADALPGIDQHAGDADPDRRHILPALPLDVTERPWPVGQADAVLAVNMIHIAPWEACLGLIGGAGEILPRGQGLLVLYGPFRREGRHTAPSNAAFDEGLRARNPAWGIRDLEMVAAEASRAGFAPPVINEMPANNLVVAFRMTE